jgi:hypothetical protein
MKGIIDDLVEAAEDNAALTPHQERELLLRRLRATTAELVAARRANITSALIGLLIGSLAGGNWFMAAGAGIGLALLLGMAPHARPEKP